MSSGDQEPENQLMALRRYAEARGWRGVEYVDRVSGAQEQWLGLDALMAAVRARTVDVVACVKLDRLARSVHHLVALAQELEALGVDLVVLDQQIDTTTPAGRLLFHTLAAISEFDRDLIRDRVLAGCKRAKAQGKRLGRPWVGPDVERRIRRALARGASIRQAARAARCGLGTVQRVKAALAAS